MVYTNLAILQYTSESVWFPNLPPNVIIVSPINTTQTGYSDMQRFPAESEMDQATFYIYGTSKHFQAPQCYQQTYLTYSVWIVFRCDSIS